jgi:hypothetical protein
MRLGLVLSTLAASAAFGNTINYVDLFHTQAFTQTSAAQPGTAQYYFAANLYLQSAGDFTSATITPPGGSASAMTLSTGGSSFGFSSLLFSDLSAFNAAYSTGTYTFSAADSTSNNPDAPQTVANSPYSDTFGTAVPYLTDFAALNGLNPLNPFTVTWNSFTGALSGGVIFFDIFNHATGADVYSQSFLASSTTSALIGGGMLAANTQYDFQLVFSNRQIGTYSTAGASFDPLLGSDLRTTGSFTTGSTAAVTPEPAMFFGVGLGLTALAAVRACFPSTVRQPLPDGRGSEARCCF